MYTASRQSETLPWLHIETYSEARLTALAAATLTAVSCLLHGPAASLVSCLVSSQPSTLSILADVSDDITPLLDISP